MSFRFPWQKKEEFDEMHFSGLLTQLQVIEQRSERMKFINSHPELYSKEGQEFLLLMSLTMQKSTPFLQEVFNRTIIEMDYCRRVGAKAAENESLVIEKVQEFENLKTLNEKKAYLSNKANREILVTEVASKLLLSFAQIDPTAYQAELFVILSKFLEQCRLRGVDQAFALEKSQGGSYACREAIHYLLLCQTDEERRNTLREYPLLREPKASEEVLRMFDPSVPGTDQFLIGLVTFLQDPEGKMSKIAAEAESIGAQVILDLEEQAIAFMEVGNDKGVDESLSGIVDSGLVSQVDDATGGRLSRTLVNGFFWLFARSHNNDYLLKVIKVVEMIPSEYRVCEVWLRYSTALRLLYPQDRDLILLSVDASEQAATLSGSSEKRKRDCMQEYALALTCLAEQTRDNSIWPRAIGTFQSCLDAATDPTEIAAYADNLARAFFGRFQSLGDYNDVEQAYDLFTKSWDAEQLDYEVIRRLALCCMVRYCETTEVCFFTQAEEIAKLLDSVDLVNEAQSIRMQLYLNRALNSLTLTDTQEVIELLRNGLPSGNLPVEFRLGSAAIHLKYGSLKSDINYINTGRQLLEEVLGSEDGLALNCDTMLRVCADSILDYYPNAQEGKDVLLSLAIGSLRKLLSLQAEYLSNQSVAMELGLQRSRLEAVESLLYAISLQSKSTPTTEDLQSLVDTIEGCKAPFANRLFCLSGITRPNGVSQSEFDYEQQLISSCKQTEHAHLAALTHKGYDDGEAGFERNIAWNKLESLWVSMKSNSLESRDYVSVREGDVSLRMLNRVLGSFSKRLLVVAFYFERDKLCGLALLPEFHSITQVRFAVTKQELKHALTVLSEPVAYDIKQRNNLLAEIGAKIASGLKGQLSNSHVVFSPPYGFQSFPFHALQIDERPWFEKSTWSYIPSLKSLIRVASRYQRKAEGGSVLGFVPKTSSVAEKRQFYTESGRVSDLMKCKSLVEDKASRDSFVKALQQNSEFLHVSCHGVYDDENPLRSSLLLSDGPYFVGDILQQEVKTNIVNLSACDLTSTVTSSGLEYAGFGQALLSAGAQTVLTAAWPINAIATNVFVSRFYEELANEPDMPIATTVQRAATYLKEKQDGDNHGLNFADPYYWAPFSIHGMWYRTGVKISQRS